MHHKRYIKVLSNISSVFECHSILNRHHVDHEHSPLTTTATAGLLEAFCGQLDADIFITEALRALKLLTLIVIYQDWL